MSKPISPRLIDPSPWADLFPHDEEHVERLKEDIAARGIKTPLHVYKRGERYELLTGHDRLEAARRLELDVVPVEERNTGLEDEEERFAYFLKDNTLRKDVDKRRIAREVLTRHPEWSLRRVAELAGCSHELVSRIRAEMEEEGTLSTVDSVVGRNGVTKPATNPRRDTLAVKRDGSIDPLKTMRAQREAASAPEPVDPYSGEPEVYTLNPAIQTAKPGEVVPAFVPVTDIRPHLEVKKRPSPAEANRIAREEGRAVVASDGRVYQGRTPEEQHAAEEMVRVPNLVLAAFEAVLRCPSPEEAAAAMQVYDRPYVDRDLEIVTEWIINFRRAWEGRSWPIQSAI